MPIITQADLNTHIYPNIIDDIVEGDATIIPTAIGYAIDEAKAYLSKYDLVQLFGDDTATPQVAATINSSYLKNILKDMVVWYLVKLSNPGVNYEHARNCYNDAIKSLDKIQNGKINMDWPYVDTTNYSTPQGDSVVASSNPKRSNYF